MARVVLSQTIGKTHSTIQFQTDVQDALWPSPRYTVYTEQCILGTLELREKLTKAAHITSQVISMLPHCVGCLFKQQGS